MKLTEKQMTKLQCDISKMSLVEVWGYRQRVSMSDIEQSQANILHGHLNERASRLDRTNAMMIRSGIDDDN